MTKFIEVITPGSYDGSMIAVESPCKSGIGPRTDWVDGKWEQMARGIKSAAFERTADGFEETVWGDDGHWDKPWLSIPFARITIDAANLIDVFDEAYETGAVIVWDKAMPDGVGYPEPLMDILEIMYKAWGNKNPPYIKVVGEPHRNVYSIKPVWEL